MSDGVVLKGVYFHHWSHADGASPLLLLLLLSSFPSAMTSYPVYSQRQHQQLIFHVLLFPAESGPPFSALPGLSCRHRHQLPVALCT